MDSLDEYKNKRSFSETPEPEEGGDGSPSRNRYVIQLHQARRTHYDFRLQVGEVLVSWAIPKKPVDDPSVKRLAIKVEDHPLSYIHFEGIIPKGNYGAGEVMVWDLGFYYLDEHRTPPAAEAMRGKIARGSLKLFLVGARLRGYYTLVRHQQEDNWFFMKAPDSEVADWEGRSLLTGRTMAEIGAEDKKSDSEVPVKETMHRPAGSEAPSAGPFPGFIPPMLATLADKPFSDDTWLFEHKLDGYRGVAARNGDSLEIYSRNGKHFASTYTGIAAELALLQADYVIDGEICYLHGNHTDFHRLQNAHGNEEAIHYFIFDLLWLNGHDLRSVPLLRRKYLLDALLADPPAHLHRVGHTVADGLSFYREIEEQELEGMIAKQQQSTYHSGERSKSWLKIKRGHSREMVVCGYVPAKKSGRLFRSLLLAIHRHGRLHYAGRVGTGFSDEVMEKLWQRLQSLPEPAEKPDGAPGDDAVLVVPEIVVEVAFSEWTESGRLRHPRFIGVRDNKRPQDLPAEERWTWAPVVSERVNLTNLDKIFWPEEGYTKGDVIAYYRNIAPLILPHLKDRPQSLYRTPDGLQGEGFFQKNAGGQAPHWVETVRIESSSGREIDYLLCQDPDTLLYMANLGCIELNPWSSSLPDIESPDYMVFDLDPVEVDFGKTVTLALRFKELFDRLGLPAFCKTSGSRGLHLYVPIKKGYTYSQVQQYVKTITTHIHRRDPGLTSMARSPKDRRGKIYLDYLQNGRGKTMAAAYSLRPRPGTMVSAPLAWEELNERLAPENFTIATMRERIDRMGDPWAGFFDRRAELEAVGAPDQRAMRSGDYQ